MSGMEQTGNTMTKIQRQVGSWLAGLLMLAGLAFFIFDLVVVFGIQNGQMDISDSFLLPTTGLMFVVNIIGFILIRRNNVLGIWLVFIVSLIVIPVLAPLVLKEIYPVAIFTTAVFAYIFRTYVFPKTHGRRALIVAGVAILSIIGIELWNPAFRVSSSFNAPSFGAGVIVLAIAGFLGLLLRRAAAHNLRTKIVVGILFTGGVSVIILTVFAINRSGALINALSSRLETTVRLLAEEQLVNRLDTEASLINDFFETKASETNQISDYFVGINKNRSSFDQGTYWNAEEKLVQLDGGQYGNSANEPSSVFVPSTVSVSDDMLKRLNTSAYLDLIVPQTLEKDPALLSVYYIEQTGVVRYYPNIELASILPPDFNATTRPYYQMNIPQNNENKASRWTTPYEDAAGGGLVVTVANPVYINGTFRGVFAADVKLSTLTKQVSAITVGASGYAIMLDDAGRIIHMPDAGYKLFNIDQTEFAKTIFEEQTILDKGEAGLRPLTASMVKGESGLSTYTANGTDYYIAFTRIPSNNYSIAVIVPTAEMQTAIEVARNETNLQTQSAIRTAGLILAGLLLLAIIISFSLGQIIARSVQDLTVTANQILEGDLTAQAAITTADEVGTLAQAFNAMTARLREALEGLEQTVNERTAELVQANENNQRRAKQFQSVALVARTIGSTLDLDSLLSQITKVISNEFGFYHVGIFLLDTAKEYAVLSAANSEGGQVMLQRGHRLKVGEKGLVGFVSSTGKPRTALDTGVDAVFFNNPDLPETRSEIALPLHSGNQVIGVLDVQSVEPNAFTREDINILSTLADQVSIAIQNARQNEETRKALAESDALSRQLVQTGWSQFTKRSDLLGVRHSGAKATLLYADKESREKGDARKQTNQLQLKGKGASLSLPIKLRGEVIGSVDIRATDNHQWDQDEMDIITAIIERAAIAMENSRLLEDAQNRAAREQAIGEMSATIGAYTDTEAILRATVDEIGKKISGAKVVFELNTQDKDKG